MFLLVSVRSFVDSVATGWWMLDEVTLFIRRSFGDSSVIRGMRDSLVTLVSLFERNDRMSFDLVLFLLVRLVGGFIGGDLFESFFLLLVDFV